MIESGDKWNVTVLLHGPTAPDIPAVSQLASTLARACGAHVDGLYVAAFDERRRVPGWVTFLIGGVVSSAIWRYLIV